MIAACSPQQLQQQQRHTGPHFGAPIGHEGACASRDAPQVSRSFDHAVEAMLELNTDFIAKVPTQPRLATPATIPQERAALNASVLTHMLVLHAPDP